jgi:hypothetical protein
MLAPLSAPIQAHSKSFPPTRQINKVILYHQGRVGIWMGSSIRKENHHGISNKGIQLW